MQQEDDLRALAKIMDFLRAVSILLVVMHVYWCCYEAILAWGVNIGVADRILMNFDRTAGLFRSMLYTKLFAVVLLGLSCLGTTGVKDEKITWLRIGTALVAGFVLFFSELVAAGFTSPAYGDDAALRRNDSRRVRLSADGRAVGEPPFEEQPHGRPVQQRERIVYAGDTPFDQRIFREPAHALLL